RFFPHPLRLGGMLTPQHDDDIARCELGLDVIRPCLTGRNVRIPEDIKAHRAKAARNMLGLLAIFARVRNEDVRHAALRGESQREVNGAWTAGPVSASN